MSDNEPSGWRTRHMPGSSPKEKPPAVASGFNALIIGLIIRSPRQIFNPISLLQFHVTSLSPEQVRELRLHGPKNRPVAMPATNPADPPSPPRDRPPRLAIMPTAEALHPRIDLVHHSGRA